MKYTELQNTLSNLEKVFGFNPNSIEQGSQEWHKMKLGVISASKAKELLSKSSTATKKTYIASLVAQIATGTRPELKAAALDWGNENEDKARASYEFATGYTVKEVPFIFGDESMRFGISPDGLIIKDDEILKGAEIKCPFNSENFIKFICDENIKKEHEKQCQFSMFVTGLNEWDYVNYDPRMTTKQIHKITYERDEKLMKLFEEAIQETNFEVDKYLTMLGLKFGCQWEIKLDKAA